MAPLLIRGSFGTALALAAIGTAAVQATRIDGAPARGPASFSLSPTATRGAICADIDAQRALSDRPRRAQAG